MTDLCCMSFTGRGKTSSEILVAGCQDTMFVIDVSKGEIVKAVCCQDPAPWSPENPRGHDGLLMAMACLSNIF